MISPQTSNHKGYFILENGILVYSQTTPPASDVCWKSKNWVANGSLERFIQFVNYAQFIQLPKTTNIHVMRRLYHNFTLHNALKDNGIDMFPVDKPEAQKSIKTKIKSFIKAACNQIPRLRVAF